jgi:hypothetical protein
VLVRSLEVSERRPPLPVLDRPQVSKHPEVLLDHSIPLYLRFRASLTGIRNSFSLSCLESTNALWLQRNRLASSLNGVAYIFMPVHLFPVALSSRPLPPHHQYEHVGHLKAGHPALPGIDGSRGHRPGCARVEKETLSAFEVNAFWISRLQ